MQTTFKAEHTSAIVFTLTVQATIGEFEELRKALPQELHGTVRTFASELNNVLAQARTVFAPSDYAPMVLGRYLGTDVCVPVRTTKEVCERIKARLR